MDSDRVDKHWAHRSILEPLTAPEPSQETGPGASHYNARFALNRPESSVPRSSGSALYQQQLDQIRQRHQRASARAITPPPHPAPKPQGPAPAPRLRHKQQYPRSTLHEYLDDSDDSDAAADPYLALEPATYYLASYPSPPQRGQHRSRIDHRSGDLNSSQFNPPSTSYSYNHSTSNLTSNLHPSNPYSRDHYPRSYSSDRNNDAAAPAAHRASSHRPPPVSYSAHLGAAATSQQFRNRQLHYPSCSVNGARPPRSSSSQPHQRSNSAGAYIGADRYRPITQRFQGDMSHRPLDMIKREARTADRRHRKRFSETDTIDRLDTIGPLYHHGGPFDATLISRNLNSKYSPVAAVHDSNMEALKATPRENIIDSLQKHRPLQGTASIPSGGRDMSGQLMDYQEGTNLHIQPDNSPLAYKGWDGVQYYPDDSIPWANKDKNKHRNRSASAKGAGPNDIELQEGLLSSGKSHARKPLFARQRSSSHTGGREHLADLAEGSSSGINSAMPQAKPTNQDLGRQNSTGHKFGQGIKRRLGSLRHKKSTSPTES